MDGELVIPQFLFKFKFDKPINFVNGDILRVKMTSKTVTFYKKPVKGHEKIIGRTKVLKVEL